MSALAKKENVSAVATAKPAATIVPFSGKPVSRIDFKQIGMTTLRNVVPPVIVLALILLVWQVLCSAPNASLPSPHVVWQQSYDLIVSPFFYNGSQDIGLGLRVLVSLQRVAYGSTAEGIITQDLSINEWLSLAVIIAIILFLGIYPQPLLALVAV